MSIDGGFDDARAFSFFFLPFFFYLQPSQASRQQTQGSARQIKLLSSDSAPEVRGELSYLAPLGSENISAPYFKQCFFRGGYYPPRQSNTTPPSPKTEINILFYILNFASIIQFKM